MSHTKEQIANWIRGQWAADYFRFDDVQADFKILWFEKQDKSLKVRLSFIADESKKGNDSESLVMFRYDAESYQGFFPNQVQIITIEMKYAWENSAACDALLDHASEDKLYVDIDWVGWNDPKISDEAVNQLLSGHDRYAIADTLINLHGAKTRMPDFVPTRLKPYFENMVREFYRI